MVEYPTGKRPADDARSRQGRHKHPNGLGHIPLSEPIRQVQQYPREEPGLRDPQQESCEVQLHRAMRESRRERYHAPADQYPRDPHARPDALEYQIAGDFKEKVSPEEHPRQQTILLAREPEL